jgi:peroxiredoxin
MSAWGEQHNADDRVMMLADGSANFTQAVGLELDLTGNGMGVRSQRYSMLINDGVVEALNIEAAGKFEVSDADTMLASL